jgi:hypothetical protein
MNGFEVCGYTDKNGDKFYIGSHQKHLSSKKQCSHDNTYRTRYPETWHTHPTGDYPFPSVVDILKVLKPNTYTNRVNTELYVDRGIWRMGSSCTVADNSVLNRIEQRVSSINKEHVKNKAANFNPYDHARKLDSLHKCLHVNFGSRETGNIRVLKY